MGVWAVDINQIELDQLHREKADIDAQLAVEQLRVARLQREYLELQVERMRNWWVGPMYLTLAVGALLVVIGIIL